MKSRATCPIAWPLTTQLGCVGNAPRHHFLSHNGGSVLRPISGSLTGRPPSGPSHILLRARAQHAIHEWRGKQPNADTDSNEPEDWRATLGHASLIDGVATRSRSRSPSPPP